MRADTSQNPAENGNRKKGRSIRPAWIAAALIAPLALTAATHWRELTREGSEAALFTGVTLIILTATCHMMVTTNILYHLHDRRRYGGRLEPDGIMGGLLLSAGLAIPMIAGSALAAIHGAQPATSGIAAGTIAAGSLTAITATITVVSEARLEPERRDDGLALRVQMILIAASAAACSGILLI